jgi:hypothetical protein
VPLLVSLSLPAFQAPSLRDICHVSQGSQWGLGVDREQDRDQIDNTLQIIKPRYIYLKGSQTWLRTRITWGKFLGWRGEIPGLTPDLLKWDFQGKARNLEFLKRLPD